MNCDFFEAQMILGICASSVAKMTAGWFITPQCFEESTELMQYVPRKVHAFSGAVLGLGKKWNLAQNVTSRSPSLAIYPARRAEWSPLLCFFFLEKSIQELN